jgi:hypothetical protein
MDFHFQAVKSQAHLVWVIMRGMKKSKLDQKISKKKIVSPKGDADVFALGSFFSLLLKIDRRNNPGFYEHNKSGASSDQTTKRLDSFC